MTTSNITNPRIIDRPAFDMVGKQTWIGGPDNEAFGRFWQQCSADGTLDLLRRISGDRPGTQTHGMVIGVSRVEVDPSKRDFFFLIGIEAPEGYCREAVDGLERYTVAASRWAVFNGSGTMPLSLVQAEMHAFMEWLPGSPYTHAPAPEMEVYPPGQPAAPGETLCEFWLPIEAKP
jgi:AraC family transcriptional regulator